MKRLRASILFLVVLAGIGFMACGGDKTKSPAPTPTTTLGQELQDLKEAYDKGIITEREYEKAKKSLMEQRLGQE
jgi:hypothetical protein